MRRSDRGYAWLLVLLTPVALAQGQRLPTGRDVSLLKEAKHSIRIGCRWLAGAQIPDGSWCQYPGITGLAVTALCTSGLPEYGPESEPVRKGVAYLLKLAKPDGSIYDRDMQSYNTSIAVLALLSTGDPAHHDVIRRARRFLIASQFDTAMGHGESDSYFGGIGYGFGRWRLAFQDCGRIVRLHRAIPDTKVYQPNTFTSTFAVQGCYGSGAYQGKVVMAPGDLEE